MHLFPLLQKRKSNSLHCGHSELSFDDKTALGISHIKNKLIHSHYTLKKVDLMSELGKNIQNLMVLG